MKKNLIALFAGAALVSIAAGCDNPEGHKHDENTAHGPDGGATIVPNHYKDAVLKCDELSNRVGELIDSGKLCEVHAAAADITKIAEKLPELAQKDLEPALLKEVNINAKELAGMFNAIDEAADAGKKEDTSKLHQKMKELIANLKKHAEGGHEQH